MEKKLLKEKEKIPSPLLMKSYIEKKITESRNSIPSFDYLSSILSKKVQEAQYRLVMAEDEMERVERERMEENKRRLETCIKDISVSFTPRVKESWILLSSLKREIDSLMKGKLMIKEQVVSAKRKELEALSPLAVLKRGFALVRDEKGRIIRDNKDVKNGDKLYITVEKGEIRTVVQEEDK